MNASRSIATACAALALMATVVACGKPDTGRVVADRRFDLPAETEILFSRTILIRGGTRELRATLEMRSAGSVTLAIFKKPDFMGKSGQRPTLMVQSGPSRNPIVAPQLEEGAYEVLVSPADPARAHDFHLKIEIGPAIK